MTVIAHTYAKILQVNLQKGAIVQIPRKIHQIFLTGDIPDRLIQQIAEIKKRNPAWSHYLYTNKDAEIFIQSHYGDEMLRVYRRINPTYGAARADLLRHLIIYKRGGVYLDIKSDLTLPIDDVLRADDQYILTQWRNGPGEIHEKMGLHPDLAHIPGGEFQSYLIIAVSGHAFSKAAIDKIVLNIMQYRPWSGVGRMGVLRTTGPIAYTLAVQPILSTAPHRFTTETEIGASMSISNYSHSTVFKQHYSTLSTPVCQLSPFARTAQICFENLRHFVQAVRRLNA